MTGLDGAPRVVLKSGRSRSIERRHPWVFSGAIARIEGKPAPGELVQVCSSDGPCLAWGHYSPRSQIRVRLFAWGDSQPPGPDTTDFWFLRVQRAIEARAEMLKDPDTDACRLVFAESDGIPGLIVDRYGDVLVLQCLTAGAAARRDLFAEILWDLVSERISVTALYERSDVDVRKREGLERVRGPVRGHPPEMVQIREHGFAFWVNIVTGHKTGFYLDQAPNRSRLYDLIRARLRTHESVDVLNVFSYTGAFSVYALAAGASYVLNVDASADALRLGRLNVGLNALSLSAVEDMEGNAFQLLRDLRAQNRRFDVVIVDPPKFATTRRDVQRAARGYKDINMLALHLCRPGGLLLTFSCSGVITEDLFQKILFGAALDAAREVQIIGRMTQGPDHPVALTFPESFYLKGLICRLLD